MRRVCSVVLLGLAAVSPSRVGALTEAEIQSGVQSLESTIATDWSAALGYTCGGLLATTDARVHAYYARRPDLACTLTEWCSEYDEVTGACIGTKCTLFRAKGVPDRTLLQNCGPNGCTTPIPHQSCNFTYFDSQARRYECDLVSFPGAPASVGTAQADCYTYLPNIHYARSYYPFSYNCVLTYADSPVKPEEPKGKPSLIPAQTLEPPERQGEGVWTPTPGSNLAVPIGASGVAAPKDSSLSALTLEDAITSIVQRLRHPTVDLATQTRDVPDLTRLIEDLLQPPEVRLLLPKNGFLLGPEQNLFQRMFNPSEAVTVGDTPDALRLAAEYLRTIPLIEVRYVPVHVLAPFASQAELGSQAREWETWFTDLEKRAGAASVTIPPGLKTTVKDNIAALHSAIALQQSIREYRTQFPEYVNALLSYVEESNTFFREQWAAENAKRLADWAVAYTTYLPAMQSELRALYAQAAAYTEACLVPACRLDTVPVLSGTKPWQLFSPQSEFVFTGPDRAWLPEGPRVWENVEGRVLQWHPPLSVGSPLPDLTFDVSELFLRRTIDVPVLNIELLRLDLPTPPIISDENFSAKMTALSKSIKPLSKFHPPLSPLAFPDLRLPDPTTSLFLVPEAPKALDTWAQALAWRKSRLIELQAICDPSSTPLTFLTHEFQLYGSREDPAARRATAFVPWSANVSPFPMSWFPWSGWSSWWLFVSGSSHLPPLLSPPLCADCGVGRTERYLQQHFQLDTEWRNVQDHFLRAVDVWNAQARYSSVVPREELEDVHLLPSQTR